jgi:hypothetical protein
VSLAVAVTVVVPIGNVLPLGGAAVTEGWPQPPLAVTEKNTVAPLELVATATILLGQSTVSGVVAARSTADPNNSRFATTTTCNSLFVLMAQQALTMVGFVFAAPFLPGLRLNARLKHNKRGSLRCQET